MDWKLPLFRIYSDEDDAKAVTEVVKRNEYWADGPELAAFEDEITKYTGRKHAVSFANGTAALHAMMLAHGIGPGDEVIVPSFTFISTANAPLFTGAKPVFADIEDETYGLDSAAVEKKITKKTKAIMPIHYGGHPCDIQALRELADKNNILLIEDAAESMGARYGQKQVGNFGDSTILSFCQNKVISTGEGGATVTDDSDLASMLRQLRSHGRSPGNYFGNGSPPDYVRLGYNWRMPSICAALGISQMNKLESIIGMRRKVARSISDGLEGVKGITTPTELKGCRHVYQMFTICLPTRKERDALKDGLTKKSVMSKVYFDPVHLSIFYRERFGYSPGILPVTERVADNVLSLPIYTDMTDSEVDYLVTSVKKTLGG